VPETAPTGRLKAFLQASPLIYLYRLLRRPSDLLTALRFVLARNPGASRLERAAIVLKSYFISERLDCPHSQAEVLACIDSILRIEGEGSIVETGCYKGGSTAKLSLAAKIRNRPLFVFDSFEGIPPNDEPHERDIFGARAGFAAGDYKGSLSEVQSNLSKYGRLDACVLVKGWFENTLPAFHRPVAVAYIDVDLASSTRTCLKYLYPLLIPGGVLLSQDGHLPLVLDVFRDEQFWRGEVHCEMPRIEGLGTSKLLKIVKPHASLSRDEHHLSNAYVNHGNT
jgi:O-methyltransferase